MSARLMNAGQPCRAVTVRLAYLPEQLAIVGPKREHVVRGRGVPVLRGTHGSFGDAGYSVIDLHTPEAAAAFAREYPQAVAGGYRVAS